LAINRHYTHDLRLGRKTLAGGFECKRLITTLTGEHEEYLFGMKAVRIVAMALGVVVALYLGHLQTGTDETFPISAGGKKALGRTVQDQFGPRSIVGRVRHFEVFCPI
jgi:hypothetical protein